MHSAKKEEGASGEDGKGLGNNNWTLGETYAYHECDHKKNVNGSAHVLAFSKRSGQTHLHANSRKGSSKRVHAESGRIGNK